MPDQNERTDGEGTPGVTLPPQKPEETAPDGETAVNSNEGSQTEEVNPRTAERIQKLLEEKKQLEEENRILKTPRPPSLLDQVYPNPTFQAPQQEPKEVGSEFIDSDGYVDTGRLKKTFEAYDDKIKRANEEAIKARQEVERAQISQDLEKAYEQHPYLDPDNAEFDEKFYKLVRNEIYGQAMEGKKMTFVNAAKSVLDVYNPQAKKQAQTDAQKAKEKETIDRRTQATTQSGTSRREPDPKVDPNLIEGTRRGDRDAIYKRLQQSGY